MTLFNPLMSSSVLCICSGDDALDIPQGVPPHLSLAMIL